MEDKSLWFWVFSRGQKFDFISAAWDSYLWKHEALFLAASAAAALLRYACTLLFNHKVRSAGKSRWSRGIITWTMHLHVHTGTSVCWSPSLKILIKLIDRVEGFWVSLYFYMLDCTAVQTRTQFHFLCDECLLMLFIIINNSLHFYLYSFLKLFLAYQ